MSRSYSRVRAEDVAAEAFGGDPVAGEPMDRPVHRPVDSNAVRWVFAATVAFWIVVYAAGRSFL